MNSDLNPMAIEVSNDWERVFNVGDEVVALINGTYQKVIIQNQNIDLLEYDSTNLKSQEKNYATEVSIGNNDVFGLNLKQMF